MPDNIAHSDRDSGAQWVNDPRARDYVYDCLYCGNVFSQSPTTGPNTGVGNMGQSYGLNVACPKCGSTNTTGPRLARIDEQVQVYQNVVSGIEFFTGDIGIGTIDHV